MSNLQPLPKDSYTEAEAADALGITISRLHQLLDQYIFTEGNQRPRAIEFTSSDVLLLSYWNQNTGRPQGHRLRIVKPK